MLPRWAPAAVAKAKATAVVAALVATGGVGGAVALDQVAPVSDHSPAHRHPSAAPPAPAVGRPVVPPPAAAGSAAPVQPPAPAETGPAAGRHHAHRAQHAHPPGGPDRRGDHHGRLHGRPGHLPAHHARQHAHRGGADAAGGTRPAPRRTAAPTGRLPRPQPGVATPDGAAGRGVQPEPAGPAAAASGRGAGGPAH